VFTDEQVIEMRQLYANDQCVTYAQLGQRYGATTVTISNAVRGITYKDLPYVYCKGFNGTGRRKIRHNQQTQNFLPDDLVVEMRRLYASNREVTYASLAKKHNVTRLAVMRAIKGITHAHLPGAMVGDGRLRKGGDDKGEQADFGEAMAEAEALANLLVSVHGRTMFIVSLDADLDVAMPDEIDWQAGWRLEKVIWATTGGAC